MFRKNFYLTLVITFVFFAVSAVAQDTSITGKVMLKKDDGSSTPVAGITVSCYLLKDFTQGGDTACGTAKSGDDGSFAITGLMAETKYVLAAYGEAIGPRVTLPVKADGKQKEITVLAGEGRSLTKIEVWQAFAFSQGSSGFTSDQKEAQALYEKELAAKAATNEKIKEKNDRIQASLEAGNKAYNDGDFDIAIVKYNEGIEADPDFVGSAPVLLNNKGAALKKRAVNTYNGAIKSGDASAVEPAKAQSLKDLSEALDSYSKALTILENASSGSVSDQANHKKTKFNAVDGGRDAVRIMALIQIADPEKVESARKVTQTYIELESDKKKKADAQENLAKFLMFAYDYEGAAAEFKNALEYSPKDPDILANL